ncbi:hypothetical protein [Rosettibacter firmus]|uniref:hypothetical protein n=1 Tax=Rosettibacter firmus TaxID=3111522 RepID=UPI00336BF908
MKFYVENTQLLFAGFFILTLFIPRSISSQIERDSSEFSTSNYNYRIWNNNVDKQLNTYSFNTQVKYFLKNPRYFLGINENFNSTVISTIQKNIKDEQYLRLLSQYFINDNIQTGIFFKNNYYSDNRQVAINKTTALNTLLYLKYQPSNNFAFVPYGGFSSNNQIGEKDDGFIYGSELLIDNLILHDFNFYSLLKFQNEDISPRKNLLRYFNLDVENKFEEGFNNTISILMTDLKKDFYFVADEITTQEFNIVNNIQTRDETIYLLQDKIKLAPQNSKLSIEILGRTYWRNIERNTKYVSLKSLSSTSFDSKIKELKLDFTSSAEYKFDDANVSLKFSFSEREEKHLPRKIEGLSEITFNERERQEALKNNISQIANISLNSVFNITTNNKLIISLFHRKLKYDTPSKENYDDRDELLTMGRILFERKFNHLFKAFINLEGSFNKIVYIYSARSSNNNVQRIIKFSSGGLINTDKFTSSNIAEVSANYTVFDFEELNPNYRSYSFRQFIFRDSTSIMLKKNLFLLIYGYTKLSEQGDFQWSSFSSKPLRYLSEQHIEPKIIFNYNSFVFGTGIRYFSLTTYNFKKGMEKNKLSNYKSVGPVVDINYEVSKDIYFKLYGWYEFVNTENFSKREIANFNMKLYYTLY